MSQTATPTATTSDPRRWKALAVLAVVNFMVILDSQIVILALPSVQAELGFAPSGAQWVMSAYLLGFGGLLLLGGRMGDLLGRRRVFLVGTALFGLASLLCGLAPSAEVLVGARAVHGVSAALMAPTALALLITTFPEGSERNKALAVWGGVGGLGATAALLVGGLLTDFLGWEWIFFLNLPVAVVLLVAAPALLRESRDARGNRRFDVPGAVTLTGALVLVCAVIAQAPETGWASAQTLVLTAVAVVLAVAFHWIESRAASPLVPLRVFRSRSLVGGNAVVVFIGMAAWAIGTLTATYAQHVLGFSPLRYGVGTIALTLMAVVGSYAAQALIGRIGIRLVAAGAAVSAGAGAVLLTGIDIHGTYFADLFSGLALFGGGLGAATVAGSVAALSDVRAGDAGVASATNTASFQIGGALGAAVATTVLVSHTVGTGKTALTAGLQAGFVAAVVISA